MGFKEKSESENQDKWHNFEITVKTQELLSSLRISIT